jgi:LacI family transcriptional regulator
VPSQSDPDLSKLDWSRYAGVYLDYFINLPAINSVCTDHSRAMIDVLDRVQSCGYRRAGLFLADRLDRRIQFRWSGAFHGYQHNHPEIGDVPPLVADDLSENKFKKWFMRHRPDVVLGHNTAIVDWMIQCGASVPRSHGFVCLNVARLERPCAGVDLQPGLLGAKGLELLIGQVQRAEMGIPENPSITSIPARWIDGPTMRSPGAGV